MECLREAQIRQQEKRKLDPDEKAKRVAERAALKPINARNRQVRYLALHPDQRKASANGYYLRNRQQIKEAEDRRHAERPELREQRQKRYRQKYPERVNERSARFRKSARHATPPWADLKAIEAVYALAIQLTKETGILHHVDHIVPLGHKLVSGLHVEWNLQAIPWIENQRKFNKLPSYPMTSSSWIGTSSMPAE